MMSSTFPTLLKALACVLLVLAQNTLTDADCWWTGCQASSWAETGCKPYNRFQSDTTACPGGFKYKCCSNETAPPPDTSDCWWTGCQPSTWEVKGCATYQRLQIDARDCDGGQEYRCCKQGQSATDKDGTPADKGETETH